MPDILEKDSFGGDLIDAKPQSPIDDACGLGLRFVLSKAEFDTAAKKQKSAAHCAHKWRKFVDNELIVKMGFMDKKRGLFSRTRMFLLTGYFHMLFQLNIKLFDRKLKLSEKRVKISNLEQ